MMNREKLLQGLVPEMPLKSIFEIGGIDREEKVITKFYQFFLRNDKTHGLGTIFIDSLISVARTKKINIPGNWDNYLVRKEVATKHNNRIDLLIEEVSDKEKKVIIIENKVNAPLKNDLEDYWYHLKKFDNDKKFAFLIHEKFIQDNCDPFIKITHAEWLKEVRKRIEKAKLRNFYAIVALEMANLFDKTTEDKNKIRAADKYAIENYPVISELQNSDLKMDDITPEKVIKTSNIIDLKQSLENRLFGGFKNSFFLLNLKDATCRRNVEQELTLKFAIKNFFFRLVFSFNVGNNKKPISVFFDFLRPSGIEPIEFTRFIKFINKLKIIEYFKTMGIYQDDPGKNSSYEIAQKQYTVKDLSSFGETSNILFEMVKKDWLPIIRKIEKDIDKIQIK